MPTTPRQKGLWVISLSAAHINQRPVSERDRRCRLPSGPEVVDVPWLERQVFSLSGRRADYHCRSFSGHLVVAKDKQGGFFCPWLFFFCPFHDFGAGQRAFVERRSISRTKKHVEFQKTRVLLPGLIGAKKLLFGSSLWSILHGAWHVPPWGFIRIQIAILPSSHSRSRSLFLSFANLDRCKRDWLTWTAHAASDHLLS